MYICIVIFSCRYLSIFYSWMHNICWNRRINQSNAKRNTRTPMTFWYSLEIYFLLFRYDAFTAVSVIFTIFYMRKSLKFLRKVVCLYWPINVSYLIQMFRNKGNFFIRTKWYSHSVKIWNNLLLIQDFSSIFSSPMFICYSWGFDIKRKKGMNAHIKIIIIKCTNSSLSSFYQIKTE